MQSLVSKRTSVGGSTNVGYWQALGQVLKKVSAEGLPGRRALAAHTTTMINYASKTLLLLQRLQSLWQAALDKIEMTSEGDITMGLHARTVCILEISIRHEQ